MKSLIAALAAALILAPVPPAAAPAPPAIQVSPEAPLMDQPFRLSLTGLPPGRPATLTARAQAQDGVWWRSAVRLPGAPAEAIDATRLIAAMTADAAPKGGDRQAFAVTDVSQPLATTFEISAGGRRLASRTVTRRFGPAGICPFAIREDGVVGVFYVPAQPGPHPGVLVIGGSDGGFGAPQVAMMLADHGFAALSLAYFGKKGLPATLEDVPMETFSRAVGWLHRNPAVDPRFVAIYSESRGTEPALYAAATTGGVDAVVARSPSFALWGGVSANHLPGKPAWTVAGKPLPAIPNTLYPGFIAAYLGDRLTGRPVRQTPLFLEDLAHFGDTARVEIPVERIAGPLLLLAGAGDQIWPSAMMAGRIEARRRRFGRAGADQLVVYPGVGHAIPYAYLPVRKRDAAGPFAVGGAPPGETRAQADAWPRILRFLTDAAKARARPDAR
ncbi:acyl-CoA thioester hydrolase/BAAT C-terminal domain-containing protein [Phenylobacterium sp.]|jgi:dienelactone hydrolase|uniref:acyl-CoA thioester hydrolase/BAAT C-terminal domain-containing protein n=1 Tax=Phenylobacterium sp. TaxID=1871053 RepID=UPI002F3EE153